MISKYFFVIAFVFFVSVTTNIKAAELEDAVEAMRSGDFAVAYCIMYPLAEDGDADAQYNIGWMYLNGYGLRVNDSLALQWWKQASEQGHVDAGFSIGMLYSLGEGKVGKDLNLAIDYYLLAATKGQEDAISLLKSMMVRNDKALKKRLNAIVNQHAGMFGETYLVKAKKLNTRSGPSTENKILAQLTKGQEVLVLNKKGQWSQVAILGESNVNKTVWVYSPLLELD